MPIVDEAGVDTRFSESELAFQAEVREFMERAWDDELRAIMPHESAPAENLKRGMEAFQNRLNERGWLAPAWPVEYGGTDWTPTQHYIFHTERARVGAPAPNPLGLVMVGPVIYTYGSEAQKRYFLPRILKSQDWWCQGYSEPGAGSDLASLQCKAEREGDHYVVTGTKVWTTYAQLADWMFCLVRTSSDGRKQDGITFLLIDMTSPGVQVTEIRTIDGWHHLNEVQLENVRVPVENRIGDEGKGWTYAKSLLVHERLNIAGVAQAKTHLESIRQDAAREDGRGRPMIDDPLFAKRLSDIEIDLMALEFTELRVLADAAGGKPPGPEAALLKLQGSQISQALHELHLDLAGYHAHVLDRPLSEKAPEHDFADVARKEYFRGRAMTIYGGSSEVQKNITSKFVLGL